MREQKRYRLQISTSENRHRCYRSRSKADGKKSVRALKHPYRTIPSDTRADREVAAECVECVECVESTTGPRWARRAGAFSPGGPPVHSEESHGSSAPFSTPQSTWIEVFHVTYEDQRRAAGRLFSAFPLAPSGTFWENPSSGGRAG